MKDWKVICEGTTDNKRNVYANSIEFVRNGCIATGQMMDLGWVETLPDGREIRISVYVMFLDDEDDEHERFVENEMKNAREYEPEI